MKRFLLTLLMVLAITFPASANYFPDVTITSTDGIWTDTRAYATINAAVTAIGAVDKRTIVIPNEQVVTALTVTANITLKFLRDGSIANSGQLTIQTLNIKADDHQIFTGVGDIDFASGSVVRSTWFSDIVEALDVTNDDTLTMIVAQTETTTANTAVGNNVTLRWDSPFIITVDTGDILSNVKNIEAGNYQILAGAGDVDFLDGTELNLDWFLNLRAVLTWVETEEVTIKVYGTHTIDFTDATTINERLDLSNGSFAIAVATTLTTVGLVKAGPNSFDLTGDLEVDGSFEAGRYPVFSGAINPGFISGSEVYLEWWGAERDAYGADQSSYLDDVLSAISVGEHIIVNVSDEIQVDPTTITNLGNSGKSITVRHFTSRGNGRIFQHIQESGIGNTPDHEEVLAATDHPAFVLDARSDVASVPGGSIHKGSSYIHRTAGKGRIQLVYNDVGEGGGVADEDGWGVAPFNDAGAAFLTYSIFVQRQNEGNSNTGYVAINGKYPKQPLDVKGPIRLRAYSTGEPTLLFIRTDPGPEGDDTKYYEYNHVTTYGSEIKYDATNGFSFYKLDTSEAEDLLLATLGIYGEFKPKVLVLSINSHTLSNAFDCRDGNYVNGLALTGNVLIPAPTNVTTGQQLIFRIAQNIGAGHTVTWNAVFKHAWSDAGNTSGKYSTIQFIYDGSNWVQVGAQSPYF